MSTSMIELEPLTNDGPAVIASVFCFLMKECDCRGGTSFSFQGYVRGAAEGDCDPKLRYQSLVKFRVRLAHDNLSTPYNIPPHGTPRSSLHDPSSRTASHLFATADMARPRRTSAASDTSSLPDQNQVPPSSTPR